MKTLDGNLSTGQDIRTENLYEIMITANLRAILVSLTMDDNAVIIENDSQISMWRKGMNSRPKYRTKQRDLLLKYFETVPGVHVTPGEVCEYFKAQDAAIGKATVYRQMESFMDEGILKKYIIDGNSPTSFEYVDRESHEPGEVSFHCKCEKYGRLIHLRCDELEEMQAHLYEAHDFRQNPMRTFFMDYARTA